MQQLTLLGQTKGQFEEITSVSQLHKAWKLVKANRGAAGVDGVTLKKFESRLREEINTLSKELREWRYKPQAVKRVEIPKPGSQDKRKLGIPTVKDRVLQQSIRLSLEPLYEPYFSESSYGFRPGRKAQDAIEAAQRIQKGGKSWVVDIDLEKFFDRINHDRLMHTLGEKADKQVLRLIGMTLRSGVLHGKHYESSPEGSPQGSPLSPLLSNIVLDEFDKELEKRGLEFCRYADDAKIFVSDEETGNRVMKSIGKYITFRLKLKVNQAKSKVAEAKDVVFLGFVVTRRAIQISTRSMKRARKKLRELIPRRSHITFEQQLERLNQWYQGWANYYQLTTYPFQLRTIEAHMRRRFRSQFISHSKRKRFLVKKLTKLGISHKVAFRTLYKAKRKTWYLSNTNAVNRAWNNEWFRNHGLLILSERGLAHWMPVKVRNMVM